MQTNKPYLTMGGIHHEHVSVFPKQIVYVCCYIHINSQTKKISFLD